MYFTFEAGGNNNLPFWWDGGIPLWTEATRQVRQNDKFDNTNVVA